VHAVTKLIEKIKVTAIARILNLISKAFMNRVAVLGYGRLSFILPLLPKISCPLLARHVQGGLILRQTISIGKTIIHSGADFFIG